MAPFLSKMLLFVLALTCWMMFWSAFDQRALLLLSPRFCCLPAIGPSVNVLVQTVERQCSRVRFCSATLRNG